MPAREAKSGTGFELLVAAALKTRPQSSNGDSIDLTEFQFNTNPTTFTAEIMRTGYPVTVDITASRRDRHYFIECKSTRNPDEVLKVSSEEFLDAMVELVAMQKFKELSKWELRFVLAVNCPVSLAVSSLLKNQPPREVRKLRALLLDHGERLRGARFSRRLVTFGNIVATLKNTRSIEFPDLFLKELTKDPLFNSNLEQMSAQLKDFRESVSEGQGSVSRYKSMVFWCDSTDHDSCEEVVSRETRVHLGRSSALINDLQRLHFAKGSPLVAIIRNKEIGYSAKDVEWSEGLSSKDAADALSYALNSLAHRSGLTDMFFCFVPGTFDVLIAKKEELAERVKGSQVGADAKYNLPSIIEMRGLGSYLGVALAVRLLKDVYNVNTSENEYLVEDEAMSEDILSADH